MWVAFIFEFKCGQYETKIYLLSNLSKDSFTTRQYQKSGIDQFVADWSAICHLGGSRRQQDVWGFLRCRQSVDVFLIDRSMSHGRYRRTSTVDPPTGKYGRYRHQPSIQLWSISTSTVYHTTWKYVRYQYQPSIHLRENMVHIHGRYDPYYNETPTRSTSTVEHGLSANTGTASTITFFLKTNWFKFTVHKRKLLNSQ